MSIITAGGIISLKTTSSMAKVNADVHLRPKTHEESILIAGWITVFAVVVSVVLLPLFLFLL